MMRVTGAVLVVAIGLTACVRPPRYIPPRDPVGRQAVELKAPFDRTWDAVIDVFAREVIPIDAIEKASGFVAGSSAVISSMLPADSAFARTLADCGRMTAPAWRYAIVYLPTSARYNVLVRAKGAAASTVQVSASYVSGHRDQVQLRGIECTSTGDLETRFEKAVKLAAEKP